MTGVNFLVQHLLCRSCSAQASCYCWGSQCGGDDGGGGGGGDDAGGGGGGGDDAGGGGDDDAGAWTEEPGRLQSMGLLGVGHN